MRARVVLKNVVITLAIVILAVAWVRLHPKEKSALFELDDGLAAGNLIALVVSRSGHGSEVGSAVEHGVRRYLAEVTAEAGMEPMGLAVYDDKSDPAEARKIAEQIAADSRVVAVIGHTDNESTLAAAPIYARMGIPMITPSADDHRITDDNEWAFSTIMADDEQGEFIAFYVDHALEGEHVVMLAHDENLDSARLKQFHETARAEGITVVDYRLADHAGHMNKGEIASTVSFIHQNSPDVIFLSLNADHTEDMLIAVKDSGYHKRIIANGPVGTPYFARRFVELPKEKTSPGYYTNDVVVPVPFILDVASNLAHRENEPYHEHYGHDMSWPFAYGYDTAKVVAEAMRRVHRLKDINSDFQTDDRHALLAALKEMNRAENGVAGIAGVTFFNEHGAGEQPPKFAAFRARSLTSDLNQFSSNSLPLEHYDPLKHTRHVEVGGEVFGLSDVVYTGVRFHNLAKIDIEKRTAYADFDLWFRYHGDFDPSDIQFDNAVEGTITMEPVEQHAVDRVKYLKVRVKGDFFFALDSVDFLQHKADIKLSFQHRKMNRDELIYVVDRTAYNTNQFNIPLIDQMKEDQVLHENEEAKLDNAFLFEDVTIVRAFGDPVFIDGKLPFSHFNVEINLHQKGLSLSRQIGRYLTGEMQTVVLFGGLLLFLLASYPRVVRVLGEKIEIVRYLGLGVGLVGAEMVFFSDKANLFDVDLATLDLIVKLLNSVWYLFIAFITHIFMGHYLWPHVERSTGYPVPSIARTIVSIVIFLAAATFIYAVVFGQSIVSIVATSGALTVVLGFALRELIMDFFAGIILNIEQPFHIGDFVSFHLGRGMGVDGVIQEMNWRTVRVTDEFGNMQVLPNSKISVQHLTNSSVAKQVEWKIPVYLDPSYDPEQIVSLLTRAVEGNPHIIGYDDPDLEPSIRYRGCENVNGMWVARYRIKFTIQHMGKRNKAAELVWKNIWRLFAENGVAIDPSVNPQGERKSNVGVLKPGKV